MTNPREPVAWMYERNGHRTVFLDRQSDYVRWGWTETPLFADERETIAACLLKQAAWHDKHDDGLSGFDRIAQGYREAADAIARGEHAENQP